MIQDIPDPDWMLDTGLAPAFEAMLDHGLVFDALVLPQHLSALLELTARYPDLSMVLDHGAKPPLASGDLTAWKQGVAALARETLMVCKLSGLVTEARSCAPQKLAPAVDHLLECFGPKRMMWGSDWPVCELTCSYENGAPPRIHCWSDSASPSVNTFFPELHEQPMESKRLAGKTAVVTAAASGIGRASAEAFARAGARVIAADIDAKALQTLAGCEAHVLDVRDAGAIEAFAKSAGKVDVLFNCAGTVPKGTVLDLDPATWNAAFDLNVNSMFHMIRAFCPPCSPHGPGPSSICRQWRVRSPACRIAARMAPPRRR
jgi:hypothetical protein